MDTGVEWRKDTASSLKNCAFCEDAGKQHAVEIQKRMTAFQVP